MKKGIMTAFVGALVVMATSCGMMKSSQTGENGTVKEYTVTLGAQSNKTVPGLLDLSTGETYKVNEVGRKQKSIDLIFAYGKNSKMNLLTPRSSRVRLFGRTYREKISKGWSVRTRGYMADIRQGKSAKILFKKSKNRDDLIEAYKDGKRIVKSFRDYKRLRDGPTMSIRHLRKGDIIVFKSSTKGVYAIAKVKSYENGYSGTVTLQVKVSIN